MESLMTSRSQTPYLILALLIAMGLTGCEARSEASVPPPPPAVDVAQVEAEAITLWDDFTGRIAAPESVELRPRVTGYIERVAFNEGDLVNEGDVLFEIDDRPYSAAASAASAELSRTQSLYQQARSEAERASRLLEGHAISQEQYDQRFSASATAHAAMLAAQAALERAELDLQYTRVRSPISGRVSRAFVTRGNLASSNQTLLTRVVSVDPVHVYFESDERTAAKALPQLDGPQSTEIRVSLVDEDQFGHRARVDFIDNQLDASTGTLQFRAVMANPDGRVRPGQFARVQMPVAKLEQALLVDQRAVLTDQDRRYVLVVGEDNTVSRRNITPGPSSGGLMVVRDGLSPGERIVVNGVQKVLMPGMQVTPELVAMRPDERAQPQLASRH